MKKRNLLSGSLLAALMTIGIAGTAHYAAALAEPAEHAQVQTTVASTAGNLVIPVGVTATYDASKGPLRIQGRLENHGTLQITGGVNNQAGIETSELQNDGTIVSAVQNLIIKNSSSSAFALDLKSGQIKAPVSIGFISDGDIKLAGGDLSSERVSFTSQKDVKVHANRIEGKIAISGAITSVGVDKGNLYVASNDSVADPVYYSFDADVTAPGFTGGTGGFRQDFVAVAVGNVTVSGDVSTNGSILILAGVNFHFGGTAPTSSGGILSDSECVLYGQTTCGPLTFIDSFVTAAKTATTQNLTSTANNVDLQSSGTITVNGAITSGYAIVSKSLGTQTFNGNLAGISGSASNTSTSDSTITLNGISCKKWQTSAGTTPDTYWNCINQSGQLSFDLIPANLISNFPADITAPLFNDLVPAQLYVFKDSDVMKQFFGFTDPLITTANAGLTFEFPTPSFDGRIYIAPYQWAIKPVVGYAALIQEEYEESTAHETGHAVEFNSIPSTQSFSATYRVYAKMDFLQLDFSTIGDDRPSSTPRQPCSADGSAPLDGVIDFQTGALFCDGNLLVRGQAAGDPYYGKTNSRILQLSAPQFLPNGTNSTPTAWRELYAQVFAFKSYVDTPLNTTGTYFITTADGVFKKTVPGQSYHYFGCIQNWAIGLLGGTPTYPSYCIGVASWYSPGQNL